MADLWSLLEDELETQALAELGGAVDELSIVTVLIDTVYNLDYLADRYELPALLIIATDAEESAGPHGDGLQHVEMTYPVRLIAVAQANDKRAAQRNAKELRRRILAFLRNADVQAALERLEGDDGERLQFLDYANSGATIYGQANQDEGPYLAVAGVRMTFQTLV